MKFLQSLKSKLLVALVLIIACTTTIVYAEGEDTNSLTTETSEGEAVVTSSEFALPNLAMYNLWLWLQNTKGF